MRLHILTLAVAATASMSSASMLIDDFKTGSYDYDSSPYKYYYNGYSHSRFYFQEGSGIIGNNRMVLVAEAFDNAQFDQKIGSGKASTVGGPNYKPYWELDYGVKDLVGQQFPWMYSNLHANIAGYDVIRFYFNNSIGNLGINININSSAWAYHDTPITAVSDSLTAFTFDMPLSYWSAAELSDVNQFVFAFRNDQGGHCDLTRIEVMNLSEPGVPGPAAVLPMIIGGLVMARRQSRQRSL